MNKKLITFFIMLLIIASTNTVQANNSNQANKNSVNHEKLYYALIMSLSPSIEKAIFDTYKDASEGIPQWAGWDTKILEVQQLQGVGGSYDVTVEASGQKVINNNHVQDIKK